MTHRPILTVDVPSGVYAHTIAGWEDIVRVEIVDSDVTVSFPAIADAEPFKAIRVERVDNDPATEDSTIVLDLLLDPAVFPAQFMAQTVDQGCVKTFFSDGTYWQPAGNQ